MSVPSARLTSGHRLPAVGFGTWNLAGDDLRTALEAALDAGYTHVDTAEGYFNEETVGEAIAASDVDREDLFLTSKVLPKNLDYESVVRSCEATLDRLDTDYLDLYLVHWPNPAVSIRETMAAMETLVERDLVRSVGVSNFDAYQVGAALRVADVPIAVNQLEYHPYYQQRDTVEFCRAEGVAVEAAAPLARGAVLDDEVVLDLAEDYDRSPAQVVLRWAREHGVVVLPKSSDPGHVRENLRVTEWSLDDGDVERLDERARDEPVYDAPTYDWSDDTWGIAE